MTHCGSGQFLLKLPLLGSLVFPKGSNDRYTVGEFFFSTGFYQYYSRHDAQVKKNKYSKRKLQILNADFSPQF